MLDKLHSISEISRDYEYNNLFLMFKGKLTERKVCGAITYPCIETFNENTIPLTTGDRLFFFANEFKEYYELLLINDKRIKGKVFMPYLDMTDLKHFNNAIHRNSMAVLIRANN